MKKVFAALAAIACIGAIGAPALAAPPTDPATPMIAPPPPRMLDPAASDDAVKPATSQRDYCRQLIEKIRALPAPPQALPGQPPANAEASSRAAERKRLDEAYRQECSQATR